MIKVTIGKSEDYTTEPLIDYYCFLKNYQIICCNLSKQKQLDADTSSIQQTEFYGKLEANSQVGTVLRKIKGNCFRILQRNSKRFVKNI